MNWVFESGTNNSTFFFFFFFNWRSELCFGWYASQLFVAMERSIAQLVRGNSVLPVGLIVESGACHLVPAAATASSSTEFRACLPKLISSFRVCETPRLTSNTTNVWQKNRIRRRVCFVQAQARKGSGDKRSSRCTPKISSYPFFFR